MDAFLLIATIIVAIILLFANFYIMIVYIHPDDKGFGDSLISKVIGLSLAWGQVLMLPLDVANSRGYGGGINMVLFWEIVMCADAIFLVLLIPFSIFFYESDQTLNMCKRIGSTLCSMLGFLIIFCLLFFISYVFLNVAQIPIVLKTYGLSALTDSTANYADLSLFSSKPPLVDNKTLELTVSFPVYIMAFFAFFGWFMVVFFGGSGLFSIPVDYINAFRFKPVQRSMNELNNSKKSLSKKTLELIEMGNNVKAGKKDVEEATGFFARRKAKGNMEKNTGRFKAAVYLLEKEFELYNLELQYSKQNPCVWVMKLVVGVILLIVAIIWWIHVLINNAIRSSGYAGSVFLNNLLNYFEDTAGVGFISTGIFAGFALYLIWSVTKGNIKVGLKIPFCFTIHPMLVNETMMNSFLFNVELVLISSIAVVQFLTNSFEQYVRLTQVDLLFGTQVKYMKFFKWFFANRVFDIAFLIWSVLYMMFLCACGGEESMQKKQWESLVSETNKARKKIKK